MGAGTNEIGINTGLTWVLALARKTIMCVLRVRIVAVLGAVAAERLGISDVSGEQRMWLGEEWFTVTGILNPLLLAADLDRAAIIGHGAAEEFLAHDEAADVIYVRAYPEHILNVRSVMAATANPEAPEEVQVSRASDVLEARAAATNTFYEPIRGSGGNFSVSRRNRDRQRDGDSSYRTSRRNWPAEGFGAARFNIATQFPSESLLLSSIGGSQDYCSEFLPQPCIPLRGIGPW